MTPEQITSYFAERFEYRLIVVEAELWDPTHHGESFHRDYHTRYGYTISQMLQTGGDFVGFSDLGTPIRTGWERCWRFCPELIAGHLQGHDQATCDAYLNSIVVHEKMHQTALFRTAPSNGVEFEDEAEEVLELMDPEAYRRIVAVRNVVALM